MNNNFILIIILSFFASCSTNKSIIDKAPRTKNTNELIKIVNHQNNYPDWLSLKGKINITTKDYETTLNINIKNKKDSVIWASATGLLGIEIFRLTLTTDSIYFANRANKTYLIKPVSYLSSFIKSEMSFCNLQEMITGKIKISPDNYHLELKKEGFFLVSKNARYSINNNYIIKNAQQIKSKTKIELILEDHEEINNFPRKVTLKILDEEIFEIALNYSKIEFNKPQSTLFKISESYNEIK